MGKHRTSPPIETGPDPNGNLLSLIRNAHLPAANYRMDQFKYHYEPETNRLMRLEETAALTPQYEGDIEPNDRKLGYAYDEIGNLVTDGPENFNISWYANGKVHEVTRGAGVEDLPDIAFTYDGAVLRTTKLLRSRTGTGLNKDTYWTKTYYVRDAQGNVMAVYKRRWNGQVAGGYSFSDVLTLTEQHLYGSTRLGMRRPDFRVATRPYLITGSTGPITEKQYGPETTIAHPDPARAAHALGRKRYELTNHLGNVLATVSDNVWATHQAGTVTGFEADVKSATDYYGFGMGMPGRVYHSGDYRYGFQDQEMDDEVKGTGNHINFRYRGYDPRVGRFWSVDPLAHEFPWQSPYSAFNNNPVRYVDPDGRSPLDFTLLIAKDGAGGHGHMGAVIQDGKGNYYYVTMGAAENAGVSKMASSGVQGGMMVMPLSGATTMDEAINMAKQDANNSPYTEHITFETTSEQDQKIYEATVEKADGINSGKENYNVLTNNCTDGCQEPIEKATGVSLPNNPVPNSNFEKVKENQTKIQNDLKKENKPQPINKDNNPGALKPWEPKY